MTEATVKALTYDWNGHKDLPISGAQYSDTEIASKVRMLSRAQLDHEAVCEMARDRIMALSKLVAALTASASEPAKPEMWQWREVRSNRHSPDDWRAGAWRDGRIPSTARATDFVRFEERALYASPVPASEPEPVADDSRETCQRCQGNGEIVTDWERYLNPHEGDAGDEAVTECPDCDGVGAVISALVKAKDEQ